MKRIITTLSIIGILGQGCTNCYDCQFSSGTTEKICKEDPRFERIKRGEKVTDYNGAEYTKCVPQ